MSEPNLKNSLLTTENEKLPQNQLSDVDIKFVDQLDKHDDQVIEYVGLTKEELMKYAKDPYWRKLRLILLVIFIVIWLLMLAASIAIIVLAPRCPPTPNLQWWQKASTIYYLHPRSFKDTDGNGQGDIQGVIEKLDYLKDSLGMSAIIVGPLQHSPQLNFGYDVIDHKTVCHRYGSTTEFEHLVHAAHKKDMKVLVDFVPNHTSKKHLWFQLSRNRTSGFEDVYIWKAGEAGKPPNNWLNVYGDEAWEFDDVRGEYFYHAYSKNEPDLNLRNPKVLELLDDALLFWLEKKIDGVRLIGAQFLFEDLSLNPQPNESTQMTSFLEESYEFIGRWRNLIDKFSQNTSLPRSYQFERLLMVSASSSGNISEVINFTNFNQSQGCQLASNDLLMSLKGECGAACLCRRINNYLTSINAPPALEQPNKFIYNWQTGGFGVNRLASRMDADGLINVLHLMHLMLPGPSIIYYGDEIAMKTNPAVSVPPNSSLTMENLSRGLSLSPMQWTGGHMAGFTTANSAWMTINDDYKQINVEHELALGSPRNLIQLFANATRLIGSEGSLQWGDVQLFHEGDVLYWRRLAPGFPCILIAINLGAHPSTINFKDSSLSSSITFEDAVVVLTTHAYNRPAPSLAVMSTIHIHNTIYLAPGDGVVVKEVVKRNIFF